MKKKNYLSIGIMSGTSLDGIDISLILSNGKDFFDPIESMYVKYSDSLKTRLSNFIGKFNVSNRFSSELISIQKEITEQYIKALCKFFINVDKIKVDIICLHGQTIYHEPTRKMSIQLCDADLIKKKFGIKTIYDFRQNDLKNGGQGAPLVPIFHALINKNFSLQGVNAYLNIGGVANVSIIANNKIIASFDTGPGMGILNEYIYSKKKVHYDKNGSFGLKGSVNYKKINKLLKDPFFRKKYPKSIDKNYFNKDSFKGLSFYDACATITEFTAECVKVGLLSTNIKIDNIILMGGGLKNKFLIQVLKDKININIVNVNQLGLNGDFIESQAFAYLGIRKIRNLPITFPQTTGVKKSVTGGKVI